MPHNLYLHSSMVQTRKIRQVSRAARAISILNHRLVVALMSALFINGTDSGHGRRHVPRERSHRAWPTSSDAYKLLSPLLGTTRRQRGLRDGAAVSGQIATLTGTLAGQIVMEGFLSLRLRPWLRRLVTRLIAIIPAVIVIAISGTRAPDRC